MANTESLTVRIEKPIKRNLHHLAEMTDRSMSYHTEKALQEYIHRERERVERLSRELRAGIASLDAGKGVRMTGKMFEDVRQRGRARLAELKKQSNYSAYP